MRYAGGGGVGATHGFSAGAAAGSKAGPSAIAGPSAESVLVLAERLSGVAAELQRLRLQLCALDSVDWNSVAATAFRKSLAEADADFVAVGQRTEAAATAAASYGMYLRSVADSPAGSDAIWQLNPGIAPTWSGNSGLGSWRPAF
ncbi:hypothetical protein AAFM46_00375 [Arthrobacter sp. TMP15]|uniref:hypothetical protein n=1 Tax=Arthrobacter sp. TMP15 TaxID=3140789 RepID=UPI0031BB2FFE